MGRHSRRSPVSQGSPGQEQREGPGQGRRRRPEEDGGPGPEPGPGGRAALGPDQHGGPGYGTPAHGVPQVRGGHPEQRETGGGWGGQGRYGDWRGTPARGPKDRATGAAGAPSTGTGPGGAFGRTAPGGGPAGDGPGGAPAGTGPGGARPGGAASGVGPVGGGSGGAPAGTVPGPGGAFRRTGPGGASARTAPGEAGAGVADTAPVPVVPGPRKEFVEAFDAPVAAPVPGARDGGDRTGTTVTGEDGNEDGAGGGGGDESAGPGWGRALTGVAAAAVTTVLAVVVIGHFTGGAGDRSGATAAGGSDRTDQDGASRSDDRTAPHAGEPTVAASAPAATYAELMTRQFPLDADLTAAGTFTAVPGLAKAPGKGQKFRYRVDIENGLGLDGTLFADAVQKTLNDQRSWAHNGAMTFERVSSGEPDFVITLASPGTTGVWCAKSGLDTTVDNVSCDSASTDRVMINAFRWARGAATFGPKAMLPYRQMLINHEVGHRLGHNHVSCRTPGALAPVMQQQTKTLDIDGIKCRPNPWVYPER
ncbi:DUF3152 domain-containing protein [Streptomyces sp. NPDC093085]|uniref:DUF3152 domain-containing protein n=1 Tax=Streptomyces sp. NPDC093085 TaxID=3155068 RepID=UPI003415C7FC